MIVVRSSRFQFTFVFQEKKRVWTFGSYSPPYALSPLSPLFRSSSFQHLTNEVRCHLLTTLCTIRNTELPTKAIHLMSLIFLLLLCVPIGLHVICSAKLTKTSLVPLTFLLPRRQSHTLSFFLTPSLCLSSSKARKSLSRSRTFLLLLLSTFLMISLSNSLYSLLRCAPHSSHERHCILVCSFINCALYSAELSLRLVSVKCLEAIMWKAFYRPMYVYLCFENFVMKP